MFHFDPRAAAGLKKGPCQQNLWFFVNLEHTKHTKVLFVELVQAVMNVQGSNSDMCYML